MIIYTCDICNREFNSKESLRSHKNWHDPIYAERSKTGANIGRPAALATTRAIKFEKQEKYALNPSKCQHCQEALDYQHRHNKFCNRSCAASYNNFYRSSSSRSKAREKLVRTLKDKPKVIKVANAKKCIICGSIHNRNGKTCSKECQGKNFSLIMKEKIANGYNPGKNRGRNKKSYLETSFENWLIQNNYSDYETEFHIKRYDENNKFIKNYFIDFYFPTLKLGIELDGTQHKNTIEKDFDRDRYISSLGIEIFRISHQEYVNKSKVDIVKQKLNIP